jgi:aminotransferase
VFTRQELEYIAELAVEFDVLIITGEVYEHIVYEPHRHCYIASLPGMFERPLCCSSLSKTYSINGWRLGYGIAVLELIEGARKVHDFLTVGAPAPLQEAAVTALGFPDSYYQTVQAEYTERRDAMFMWLDQAGLEHTSPQGAYYVMVDISEFGWESDVEFCEWMVREIGIAAVPGSSFYHTPVNHLIRLNFAKRMETIEEIGNRLCRLKELL